MTTGAPLRPFERQQFLSHLANLGSPDPQRRVAETMQRKGLDWSAMIPAGRAHEPPSPLADDWREQAQELFRHPSLSAAERATVRKIAGWRAPGVDGVTRLREIATRVGWHPRANGEETSDD